jgi:hypothetical protein
MGPILTGTDSGGWTTLLSPPIRLVAACCRIKLTPRVASRIRTCDLRRRGQTTTVSSAPPTIATASVPSTRLKKKLWVRFSRNHTAYPPSM